MMANANKPNQRFMHRIPANSKVRRRLFPEDEQDQAKTENYTNSMQEWLDKEQLRFTEKYNFDFKNELALKGNYIWMRKRDDEWNIMEVKDVKVKDDNEKTPVQVRDRSVPAIRKRRREEKEIANHSVRRRLSLVEIVSKDN